MVVDGAVVYVEEREEGYRARVRSKSLIVEREEEMADRQSQQQEEV